MTIYVTEFSGVGGSQIGGQYVQAAAGEITSYALTPGTPVTLNAKTTIVRVCCDATATCVKLSAAGTAPGGTGCRIAPNGTDYFGVSAGVTTQINSTNAST